MLRGPWLNNPQLELWRTQRECGRLIKGDNLTVFFGGSRFADLKNGARVEVKGEQRDGFVYADQIQVNGK